MDKPPNTTTSDSSAAAAEFQLVGYKNFVRINPRSDTFPGRRFHHIDFWCGDATNTARRFSWGLGMPLAAKSDLSTGNSAHASYLLRSGHLNFLFFAPYSPSISIPSSAVPAHRSFTSSHGLAVRAVAIHVDSTFSDYSTSISLGAKPVYPPILLSDNKTVIAEVHLYGDAVLRYVSCDDDTNNNDESSNFLPGYFCLFN